MTAADFNNIVANTAAPVADKYCGRYLSDDPAGMVGDENICCKQTNAPSMSVVCHLHPWMTSTDDTFIHG